MEQNKIKKNEELVTKVVGNYKLTYEVDANYENSMNNLYEIKKYHKIIEVECLDSCTSIPPQEFTECVYLEKVILSESLKKIEFLAFYCCEKLQHIVIPASVEEIGDMAFSGCELLPRIDIPASVKEIGFLAFASCYTLEIVTLSEGLKKIGESAFSFCKSLPSITIPASVEEIEDLAFFGCESLQCITIPASLEKIGKLAFSECTSLASMSMTMNQFKKFASFDLDDNCCFAGGEFDEIRIKEDGSIRLVNTKKLAKLQNKENQTEDILSIKDESAKVYTSKHYLDLLIKSKRNENSNESSEKEMWQ